MHRFGIMTAEQQQLLREIDIPLKEHAFDPDNFGSTTRCEAIRALGHLRPASIPRELHGKPAREQFRRQRIDEFLDSSQSLSTQENFWLLLAFKTMHPPRLKMRACCTVPRRAEPSPHWPSRPEWRIRALGRAWEIRKSGFRGLLRRASTGPRCAHLPDECAQFRTDSPVTAAGGQRIRRRARDEEHD